MTILFVTKSRGWQKKYFLLSALWRVFMFHDDDEIYFNITLVCKIAVITHTEPLAKIRIVKIPADWRPDYITLSEQAMRHITVAVKVSGFPVRRRGLGPFWSLIMEPYRLTGAYGDQMFTNVKNGCYICVSDTDFHRNRESARLCIAQRAMHSLSLYQKKTSSLCS